jgi:hypothetical protein
MGQSLQIVADGKSLHSPPSAGTWRTRQAIAEPAWDWDEVVAGVASQTQASDLDVTTVVAVQRAANVNPIVRQIQKRSFGGGGGYRRKVRRARSGGLCIGVRALLAGLRGELRVSAKATQLLATALLVASCSRRCTPASYQPTAAPSLRWSEPAR